MLPSFVPKQDIYSDVGFWVEVLVDCPGVQKVFIYRVPQGLQVQSGSILSVPFGSHQMGAIALRRVEQLPPDLDPSQIREVRELVSRNFFPGVYWRLLEQVAAYYYTPLSQVVRVALPPGLLRRSQRRIRLKPETVPQDPAALLSPPAQHLLERLRAQKKGDYTWRYLQRQVKSAGRGLRELLQQGWIESYLEPPAPIRPKQQQVVTLTATEAITPSDLSPRQGEVLSVLRRRGGEFRLSELLHVCQVTPAVVKALARKGHVVIHSREILRTESGPAISADQPKALTVAQAQALATINTLSGFAQVLLHGVTGSGKTEVYLQAIAPVLKRGDSALVLVPEIGLTPQLTDRFRARFGQQVKVYHSALSDGERYDTWRLMLLAEPQVVIGTRSAVFAPLPRLGLIVLDEEHDTSFKQDQPLPCYHARSVARWRAQLEQCPLILGSATPSLEGWAESHQPAELQRGTSHYLELPERVYARPLPPIEIVDMRQELQQGNRSMFSRSLREALELLQERGEQGILFIHRRGHSTFVSCRSCGTVLECPNCDVSLTYHQAAAETAPLLRCHYCNFVRSHPRQCPECGSPYLKYFGSGTQRVVQELTQQFPQLRWLRFDSDTTRTKGAHRTLLAQFAQGEADVLVGTQMLTKGIDLPQVTLVGVVAADGLLHFSDFRASERTFQTLTQVAGRAGRGEEPGQVIIQTYSPEHPVIQATQRHDYPTFVTAELDHRRSLNYPPFGRLILLRLSSPDAAAVEAAATTLAARLSPPAQSPVEYTLLGPAPAQITRVAQRYRWQILLKLPAEPDSPLPDLTQLRSHCPPGVSLTIDVDPLNLL